MESAHDVAESLHRLTHRLKRRLHEALREDEGAATSMEVRALAFFSRHPGGSASDLVAHAGRDKAQVARLVALLVERGLLQSAPAPNDQRRLQLTLTAAGRKVEARMAAQRRRIEARMLRGFSSAELVQLRSLLERMGAALDG